MPNVPRAACAFIRDHPVPLNLLDEEGVASNDILDRANEQAIHHAHEKGLGVVIMGPVGGGRLASFWPEIVRMVPGGVKLCLTSPH